VENIFFFLYLFVMITILSKIFFSKNMKAPFSEEKGTYFVKDCDRLIHSMHPYAEKAIEKWQID
jgi:hypothetical protein